MADDRFRGEAGSRWMRDLNRLDCLCLKNWRDYAEMPTDPPEGEKIAVSTPKIMSPTVRNAGMTAIQNTTVKLLTG